MANKYMSIRARVTPEEHAAIEKKAAELGMNISSLIRLLARVETQIIFTAKGDITNEL